MFWLSLNLLIVVVFVVAWLLLTSVYVIPADKVLATFNVSTYTGVVVSGTYEQQNGLRKDARRGNVPFFPDITIQPWPIWHGVYFPTTNVVLKYHSSRVYTKDGIPVLMDGTIVFELDAYLAAFISEFNVLSTGENDVSRAESISFVYEKNPENGEKTMHYYNGPCLAQIVLDDTTDAVHEASRKVASEFNWKELTSHVEEFERRMIAVLAAPESRFAKAGMLIQRANAAGELEGHAGPSVRPDGIDINFEDVVPADPEFLNSLSAPAAGQNRGEAEGNRMRAITAATGMASKEIMRNETVRAAEELNIIAAGDTLSAVVGGLIAGRNSPKSGTKKKPNP